MAINKLEYELAENVLIAKFTEQDKDIVRYNYNKYLNYINTFKQYSCNKKLAKFIDKQFREYIENGKKKNNQ